MRAARLRDWCRRAIAGHRALALVIGTVVLFGCATISPLTKDPGSLSPAELTVAAVTYVSLAAIAVAALPAWLLVAAAAAGAFISLAAGARLDLTGPLLLVAVLVFSMRSELTPAIIATMAAMGVVGAGDLLFDVPAQARPSDLGVIPALAVVATAGLALRVRRGQKAMLEEKREHDAWLRIHSERLRIARDLHDAVGHQVALISVQAGAMGYLLDTDPGKARESLAHIQRASEAALEELRLAVGLLRQPGDSEPTERRRARQARRAHRLVRRHRPERDLQRDRPGPAAARGGRPHRVPRNPGVADQYREARGRGVRLRPARVPARGARAGGRRRRPGRVG